MSKIHDLGTMSPLLQDQIFAAAKNYKPVSCLFFEEKLLMPIFAKRDFDPFEKKILSDGLAAISEKLKDHYEENMRIINGVK